MIVLLNNTDNLISFGYSILTGIIAGILYDIFRAFRYTWKARKNLKYIGDLVFWFLVTIFFFLISLRILDGILRGFLFIGFFAGGTFYFLTISKYIFPIFKRIFKLIIQSINEIIKIFKIPFDKLKLRRKIKKVISMRKEMKAERKKHWKSIKGKK